MTAGYNQPSRRIESKKLLYGILERKELLSIRA